MSEFDYEPMSEKRLAEIIDENERCDDGSWGVHRVAELLDEVLRARHFEAKLRGELAAMRDGLVAIYSPGDERGPYTDSSYTLAAAQAIVVDGGSVWTRLVGQWREVEEGGGDG